MRQTTATRRLGFGGRLADEYAIDPPLFRTVSSNDCGLVARAMKFAVHRLCRGKPPANRVKLVLTFI